MKSNEPKIIFKDSLLKWQSSTLNKLMDRVKSYPFSRSFETKIESGYKHVHYGDIHTGVAELISKSSDLPSIKKGDYELLKKGDIILADASEDYQGIAKPAVVLDDLPYNLIAGLHTIALRPKNLDSLFLYYSMYARDFRKYGYKNGTGMKVFGISLSNVLKYELNYPSVQAQYKIGKLLKSIDDTIFLHQQELAVLKQTKQSFLQKMFPRNGETKPVVRFEEYEENWKQKKLGDILKVNSGRDYKHLDEGNIPVYGTGGLMLNVNESLSNEDAIGIGRKGTIDKPQLLRAPFWTVDTLFFMTMKKDIDLYFCFSLITRIPWKKYDESTGVPSLSKTNIDKIAIKIPSYDEQVKIGNFFKKLDAVIELKEQELEALKQTKQGFLQKMFV